MKSSDHMRPSSRRGASGAWNRLKPVREDTLESYGLPSKGETRLNDFKTQELYLSRITEKYMKLCAINREDLERLFATVSTNITGPHAFSSSLTSQPASKGKAASTQVEDRLPASSAPRNTAQSSIDELATVLTALRKLREAITASNRADAFARRAYYFSIHVAVLCHDWESYLPALHALLNTIHPRSPLPAHDLKEFVGLQILDQACRQSDFAGARETKILYKYTDRRVETVMRALVADDWVTFWRMRRGVDGYQRSVMQWAEARTRIHALKCLGKAYMSADKLFVERCTDRSWADLVQDGVGWELTETDKVLIKKPKGK